jgi:hypothetical protein
MSGNVSERVLGTIVTATLGIATFVAAPSASAQTEQTQVCSMALLHGEDARSTLADLEEVVTTAKANRNTLRSNAAELSRLIAEADSVARADALRADRFAVLEEIALIDKLLPPIESQTKALARDVAAAQDAYAACLDDSRP